MAKSAALMTPNKVYTHKKIPSVVGRLDSDGYFIIYFVKSLATSEEWIYIGQIQPDLFGSIPDAFDPGTVYNDFR